MIFDNSSQLLRILFQLANSLKISWVRRRMVASIATQKFQNMKLLVKMSRMIKMILLNLDELKSLIF